MSKKLKLFGLLALTVALAAGVAWAFDLVVLPAGSDVDQAMVVTKSNTITGNGTFVGGITGVNAIEALKLQAAVDNTVTIAPKATKKITEDGAQALQVIVNKVPFTGVATEDAAGTVIMKGANADNPDASNYTKYTGGTVLEQGVLGVTNSNSLGQAWIGVVGYPDEKKAPVFRAQGTNAVTFGNVDEGGTATKQPFFLGWVAVPGADAKNLRFVEFDVPQTSASNQGLSLRHGLDQRDYVKPTINPAAADAYATVTTEAANDHYVRLVKTGNGRLYINGGIRGALSGATDIDKAFDGAFHRGGTTVKGGVLEVMSEADANVHDHFRASLGKTWGGVQGSSNDYANLKSFVGKWAKYYNPLWVTNDGKVKLNKSQFFTDFNIDEKATFQADDYTLASSPKNSYPQIAVTLAQKDSYARGLLTGDFDLVLNSVKDDELAAGHRRPADDEIDKRIQKKGYAVLFIENENNTIGAERETEVAEGVLEIAGAKSIGGGQVDVGASDKRGFVTAERGVFAASKSFRLPNTTLVHTKGMLAAEAGTELSFKNVTIHNLTSEGDEGSVINPEKGSDPKYFWSGTVTFGPTAVDSGDYFFEGTVRNPSIVKINKGVWQLNSYPSMDVAQIVSKENPYASVTISADNATLSLGDGARDFSKYMTLTVNDDSRIRMVLNSDDIAATRADAMGKDPVFKVRLLDVSGTGRPIGAGETNRDRRLNIQLDASKIGNTIKSGWVKVFNADDAIKWNDLHFLRENSNVNYEDYAKVRIGWSNTSDLTENTKAVAHLDENSNTILIEFGANVTDPVNPNKPTPPAEDKLTTTLTPSATSVAPGAEVIVTLGEWTYKGASADVVSEDVTVTGGTIKTPLAGKKVVLTAGAEGTMTVTATSVLKSDPKVPGKGTTSITVTKGGSGKKSSSGGGCDAGFGGLALALAAAFLLKRKA